MAKLSLPSILLEWQQKMAPAMQVALFPLRTVLYPGGPLPLRIFETRYIDMIGRSLKRDEPFGVLLIKNGHETGPANTCEVGTLARIQDWYQGSDGLLGVTAIGEDRFRLISSDRMSDGLNVGEIELLPDVFGIDLPDDFKPLASILEGVLNDLGRLYENLETHYTDACWVAHRFAEILPMSAQQKQLCLEANDPVACLEIVRDVMNDVQTPDVLEANY
jgi:Lon protease-like protein